jgi:hypothetical protein
MKTRLGSLSLALFTAVVLMVGPGTGAYDYANQYVNAINGVPGWIEIWPYSSYFEWQLYEGTNSYDSYPAAGPEDWYLSSNKDWHAEIYDASGMYGHFYDGISGYTMMDPMKINAYTYVANGSITLSNGNRNLWAGPAGENLWLDNQYSQYVYPGEPESQYSLSLGAYAYTDY